MSLSMLARVYMVDDESCCFVGGHFVLCNILHKTHFHHHSQCHSLFSFQHSIHSTMITKLSLLAALGVLFITIGVSQSSSSLRGNERQENDEEIKYISIQEITAKMETLFGKEIFEGTVEDGLRKLNACGPQLSCDGGGASNYVMTFGGRNWGSCQNMDHCLCGLVPMQMAFWCPYQCRPGCGSGACATPQECPNGFNIENGAVTPYTGELPPAPYTYWPCNLGPACTWYSESRRTHCNSGSGCCNDTGSNARSNHDTGANACSS